MDDRLEQLADTLCLTGATRVERFGKQAAAVSQGGETAAPKPDSPVVYHGSLSKFDVLTPRDEHGDPDVGERVFATPDIRVALAYLGRKWGDRDINQGRQDSSAYLREMRPSAFEDIFGGVKGHLHELPASVFSGEPGRDASYEVTSKTPVKPLRVKTIENIQKQLQDAGVELQPYDPDAQGHKDSVARMQKRVSAMSPESRERYLKWVGETNPELAAALGSAETKTSECWASEHLEKQAADLTSLAPKWKDRQHIMVALRQHLQEAQQALDTEDEQKELTDLALITDAYRRSQVGRQLLRQRMAKFRQYAGSPSLADQPAPHVKQATQLQKTAAEKVYHYLFDQPDETLQAIKASGKLIPGDALGEHDSLYDRRKPAHRREPGTVYLTPHDLSIPGTRRVEVGIDGLSPATKVQLGAKKYPLAKLQELLRSIPPDEAQRRFDTAKERQFKRLLQLVHPGPVELKKAAAIEPVGDATGLPDTVYHASPYDLDILSPKDDHGDPDVAKAVFATKHPGMVLAYLGKKWGDRDIEQGSSDNGQRWHLREMRPGAFKDIYPDDHSGYLYELPADTFRRPERSLGSDYEVISDTPVAPLKKTRINDILATLKDAGVELTQFDDKADWYRVATDRMRARRDGMSEEDYKQYMEWVRETNPLLADRLNTKKTAESQVPHVFITGAPGAGKTTRAKELAEERGLPIMHLDDWWDAQQTAKMNDRWKRRLTQLKTPHVVEGWQLLQKKKRPGEEVH